MDVYLNGHMTPYDEARVSHDDAGLQHAVGLFETMAACGGRVFRLGAHVDRLAASAAELGLSRDLDRGALAEAVERTVAHNRLDQARLRLTVTPGRVSLLRPDPAASPEPTVLVVATPPVHYDPALFERGVMVTVAPPGANPFDPAAGHKTLAYWSRLRLLRQASAAGAGEAVVPSISNHLAGGTISNLFLVKDGALHTPIARGEEVRGAMAAPVLPGTTRAAVIELAKAADIAVHRRMLGIADLLEADEAFLTNASWHLLPVSRVEKSPIGEGATGALSRRLRADLLALIRHETGGEPLVQAP